MKNRLFWEKVHTQWEKALRIIPSSMLVSNESYVHLLSVAKQVVLSYTRSREFKDRGEVRPSLTRSASQENTPRTLSL